MVAQSTQEAEYVALSWATREATWLSRMAAEIKGIAQGSTIINCDNQTAIGLSRNDVLNDRTKHIDVKFHFIRDQVEKKNVIINYCSTAEMLADLLTKNLKKVKHNYFCEAMGMELQ